MTSVTGKRGRNDGTYNMTVRRQRSHYIAGKALQAEKDFVKAPAQLQAIWRSSGRGGGGRLVLMLLRCQTHRQTRRQTRHLHTWQALCGPTGDVCGEEALPLVLLLLLPLLLPRLLLLLLLAAAARATAAVGRIQRKTSAPFPSRFRTRSVLFPFPLPFGCQTEAWLGGVSSPFDEIITGIDPVQLTASCEVQSGRPRNAPYLNSSRWHAVASTVHNNQRRHENRNAAAGTFQCWTLQDRTMSSSLPPPPHTHTHTQYTD
jgi:hypothetical protein